MSRNAGYAVPKKMKRFDNPFTLTKSIIRSGSRTAATSNMERFVIIVSGCCSSPKSASDDNDGNSSKGKHYLLLLLLLSLSCIMILTVI